eukprot:TRINITY_DN11137_c0_g1::TRINITY_DN11137_c0_g1_i1::g.6516::m.6516 TRINITY_DN11137_c0_g1::TRINITY_DN11137_c0_g1_i1::g.6516  ORF type:complete len:362 (-),score=99.42,Imm11/PF15563.1/0.31,Imm11/PF15563.1/1.1e+03 TRINITY_DN11137_c0_g1_i1:54-1139(-)
MIWMLRNDRKYYDDRVFRSTQVSFQPLPKVSMSNRVEVTGLLGKQWESFIEAMADACQAMSKNRDVLRELRLFRNLLANYGPPLSKAFQQYVPCDLDEEGVPNGKMRMDTLWQIALDCKLINDRTLLVEVNRVAARAGVLRHPGFRKPKDIHDPDNVVDFFGFVQVVGRIAGAVRDDMHFADRCEHVIKNCILPNVGVVKPQPMRATKGVGTILAANHARIEKIFNYFVDPSPTAHNRKPEDFADMRDVAMNLNEFLHMLKAFDILSPRLNVKQATHVFSVVSCVSTQNLLPQEHTHNADREITLEDFCEVLTRISCMKFKGEGLTVAQCLAQFLQTELFPASSRVLPGRFKFDAAAAAVS